MDRSLISLKYTMLGHSPRGLRMFGWLAGAALVGATWGAAQLAETNEVRSSVLTLAFLTWGVGAAVGPILLSGKGVLRPDYFALLPVSGRTLARGLLVSVFASVAAAFVLLAYLAAAVHAVALAPATLLVVAIGAPLTWIFVIAASRLIFALLGAAMKSRLGIEIAGIQFGLIFAAIFTGWMVVQVAVQNIPVLLRDGLPSGAISTVVDAAPTSWFVLAIDSMAAGDTGTAAMLLGGLALLDMVVVGATIVLLVPRSSARSSRRRSRARSTALVAGGGLLPRTQLGAVIGKELRQWNRDAWRSLETRSCVWTGVAIGFFAWASGEYAAVAPFAGLIVALMLGLGACNLFGQDGTAVWQNIVGQNEGSVRSDVVGRQLAALIVFVPQALLVSAVFVVLSGQWATIPVLLAALPAAFGVASGAAMLVSAIGVSPGVDPRRRVGPNDANGNISLHVWVVILILTIGVLPTAAVIVASFFSPSLWLGIAAIAVGVGNGALAAWTLGRVAIARLSNGMPDVYSRIRYGRIFRESDASILGKIETATLKGERTMHEQRQKEREKRAAVRAGQ